MLIERMVEKTALLRGSPELLALELAAAVEITAELAARSDCPPAGVAWWVRVLSGSVERDYTMAQLAQESAVLRSRLYAGTLNPPECVAVSRVLTVARDRLWSGIVAAARGRVAEDRRIRLLLGDPAMIAESEALLAACDRAAAPIIVAPPPREHAPAASAIARALAGSEAAPAIAPAPPYAAPLSECERCSYLWRPRVPQPRRCPRCQVPLLWSAPATPAPPAAP